MKLVRSLTLVVLAASLAACDPPRPSPPIAPSATASFAGPATASSVASAAPSGAATSTAVVEDYPPPPPPDPPIVLQGGGKDAVRGEHGLVTSVDANATRIGTEVLKKGGNAFDATVAVAYALAVTHPSAGNLGGGGFMIFRLKTGETYALDFREIAPADVTTEKILKNIAAGAEGYASAAVPGTVAGMSLLLSKHGTRPLAELIAPSIALARSHKVSPRTAVSLKWNWEKLQRDPLARGIWGGKGKDPVAAGQVVRQKDLAKTLEVLAKEGPKAFYEGAIADAIEAAMKKNGGYVTKKALGSYQALIRKPLRFQYRGFTVDTMPPPSMGGIAFAQILLTLERLHAEKAPVDSAESLHLFIEASRRAYVDRRLVGADPAFQSTDILAEAQRLLTGAYLEKRTPAIDRTKATPSADIVNPLAAPTPESPQTTHFSIVDKDGNAVACTTTLSAAFGAKVVVPGTGLLLANALGAFSERGPNTVAEGKRPASSMTPAIVTQEGKLRLVLGTPGGDTIPNTVVQVFRNVVDHGMTIDQAASHGRIHHQYMPDQVRVEQLKLPPRATLDALGKMGHKIVENPIPLGHTNNILVDSEGILWGYTDLREGGKSAGF